jgi:hypothetical protein
MPETGSYGIRFNDFSLAYQIGEGGTGVDGSGSGFGAGSDDRSGQLRLRQNDPNPFGGQTAIEFELAAAADVRVEVYDVAGRLVAVLSDDSLDAGEHSVTWDGKDDFGRDVAAGVYFVSVRSEGAELRRKMVRVRGILGRPTAVVIWICGTDSGIIRAESSGDGLMSLPRIEIQVRRCDSIPDILRPAPCNRMSRSGYY